MGGLEGSKQMGESFRCPLKWCFPQMLDKHKWESMCSGSAMGDALIKGGGRQRKI